MSAPIFTSHQRAGIRSMAMYWDEVAKREGPRALIRPIQSMEIRNLVGLTSGALILEAVKRYNQIEENGATLTEVDNSAEVVVLRGQVGALTSQVLELQAEIEEAREAFEALDNLLTSEGREAGREQGRAEIAAEIAANLKALQVKQYRWRKTIDSYCELDHGVDKIIEALQAEEDLKREVRDQYDNAVAAGLIAESFDPSDFIMTVNGQDVTAEIAAGPQDPETIPLLAARLRSEPKP